MVRRKKPTAGVRRTGDLPYGQAGQLDRDAAMTPPPADPARQFQAAREGAQGMQVGAPMWDQPSMHPGLPTEHGLSVGPGAGPEALTDLPTAQPDPDLVYLASALPLLEVLADRPGASVALANIVRRLRAVVPVDFDFADIMPPPEIDEFDETEQPRGERS